MHPTIRAISGAPATTALDAKSTALVVIDIQREYFEGGKLYLPDGQSALMRAKKLIAFADAQRIPVFHVQHVGPAGGPLFARDGAGVEFHREIMPAPHHRVVQKTSPSSFVGTDLDELLKARGIQTLLICGLMTHMCVSTTARDARPRGYRAIVAGDACATRDIDGWDGGVVTHAALHRAALTEVSDSFAEVMSTEQVTGLAVV
jgi:nicotinamidase-related amidase